MDNIRIVVYKEKGKVTRTWVERCKHFSVVVVDADAKDRFPGAPDSDFYKGKYDITELAVNNPIDFQDSCPEVYAAYLDWKKDQGEE